MADQVTHKENIEAYKQGVSSTAPATGWDYSITPKPAGKSDVDFAGVEVESHDAGLTTHDQKMRLPEGNMSVRQIFSELAGIPESSLKREPPGQASSYYREIGQHEGGHLHRRYGTMDGGLKDEISGDLASMNGDNPEVESALKDARKISAIVNPSHATSLGLPAQAGEAPPDISTIKLFAAATELHDTVASDLMSKGHIRSMDDLKTLQKEHPEQVLNSVKELRNGGAFDQIEGSKGRYIREMVKEYVDAMDKWVTAPPSTSQPAPTPQIPAPRAGEMAP